MKIDYYEVDIWRVFRFMNEGCYVHLDAQKTFLEKKSFNFIQEGNLFKLWRLGKCFDSEGDWCALRGYL